MLRRAVAPKVGIVRWVLGALAAVAFIPTNASAQVTFNVGVGGQYTTIQAAVNVCPPAGCILNLTDTVYKQAREIWIEGKNNLTIQAASNLQLAGIKPRIYYAAAASEFGVAGTAANPSDPERPAGWKKWPNSCQANAGGSKNTSNQYSTSGFQHNGLIVVYKSTNVRIEGVKLDGKSPQYFVNKGIWNCQWDVLFGNVGFNLFQSKSVVLRNNEMTNFFASIYMQNRNVGGAFAAPNPDDLDVKSIVPYSAFGKVGDHLIEKNYIHNNWWGVYNEMEWDIGSTIRYNILDSNFNTRYSQSSDSTSEANNMAGGFMYLKDVMIVPHKIYNNTMNGGVIVLGHGGFKPGIQHYFYNNLLTGWNRKDPKLVGMLKDFRQLMSKYKDFLYNNTFELGIDSAFQIQSMSSEQIPDSLACASAGQVGQKTCYLPLDSKVDVYTGIQLGKALWDGWNVAQGGYFTATYKTKPYRIYNNQVVDVFGTNASGIIQKSQGVGTTQVDISSQANYWARRIKYKSIKPGTAGYMEPVWGDPTVDSTVLDKGWVAAGNRDQDGTLPDRGAIPQAKGALISPLTLKDQTIVTMSSGSSATTKKVSFQYCLDGAGSWSNLQFEMKNYYKQVGRRSIDPATGSDKDPWIEFSTPVSMQPTSSAPVVNQCNTFTAEVAAPVDSFARFELIVKGDLNGQSVRSNVGVWIWRKTQYVLDVFFTRPGTTDTVKSVRVGEPVDMHVRGLRTDNGTTIQTIDVLTANPNKNTFLVTGDKQIMPNDTIGKALAGAGTIYPVYFRQTGTVVITMAGMVGTLPVPGSGSITVRPGLPEKVEWQYPPSYKYLNHATPVDSLAEAIPQSPTVVKLQVMDRWGNNVDTIASISVTPVAIDIIPPITQIDFAPTVNGPFANGIAAAKTFTSDVTGAVNLGIMVKGIENQKFWGIAKVVGKDSLDSAAMKVGKQLERLYFTPVVAIDTFVTVKQKVHVILSEDGLTVKSGSAFATAIVKLRSAQGTQFFETATSTTPIDSIALVNGAIDLWVTSTSPVAGDSLFAYNFMLGSGLPTIYAPVTFRMPPTPPAPSLSAAGFIDVNCDGFADTIAVALGGELTAAVKIDSIHVMYGTTNIWVKSGWRVLADNKSVRLALPVASTVRGSLTGSVAFAYTVARPPVPDTSYTSAVAVIADMIGPALMDTAYLVENFSRPSQNDTLKVQFTEPVNLTASGWPFVAVNAAGAPVASGTLAIKAPVIPNAADPTRYTIVFEGNTAGSLIAQGYRIRLSPTASVADLASNVPAGLECSPGVPVVEVPSPIPVRKVWLKDSDGNGAADRLFIQFAKPSARSIKASDMPTSAKLTWASTLDTATAFSGFLIGNADSTIWELPIGPMMKGATFGYSSGNGLVAFTGAGRAGEVAVVEDSVSPIAIKASIRYGTVYDSLTVVYSEGVKRIDVLGNYMSWKKIGSDNSTEAALAVMDLPKSADSVTFTFLLQSGSVVNPQPGDSVRLPIAASKLVAINGTQPSNSLDKAPYVVVTGGDRGPSAAWYKDTNADGIVDFVGMEFNSALKTSPSFVFRVGTESRTVDSSNGLVISADRKSASVSFVTAPFTISSAPFATVKTFVEAASEFGTMTSMMGDVVASANFPIRDSIDPFILSAYLTYASYADAAHQNDTLRLKLSEPVRLTDAQENVAWFIRKLQPRSAQARFVQKEPGLQIATDEILLLLDTSKTYTKLKGGDSVRIAPIDAGGDMTDLNGNAPTLALAKWTPIIAAPRPPRFNVGIFPTPIMEVDPVAHPDNPVLSQGKQVTVWIAPKGADQLFPVTDGNSVNPTASIERGSVIGNAIGPKFTVNGLFDATALIYDNMGVYVGQTTVKLDSTILKSYVVTHDSAGTPSNSEVVGSDGSFEVVILWNGKNEKGQYVGSGVYMFRVVVYQDQLDRSGHMSHVMVMNQVTKVGIKLKTK